MMDESKETPMMEAKSHPKSFLMKAGKMAGKKGMMKSMGKRSGKRK